MIVATGWRVTSSLALHNNKPEITMKTGFIITGSIVACIMTATVSVADTKTSSSETTPTSNTTYEILSSGTNAAAYMVQGNLVQATSSAVQTNYFPSQLSITNSAGSGTSAGGANSISGSVVYSTSNSSSAVAIGGNSSSTTTNTTPN